MVTQMVVTLQVGLQARTASSFVQAANRFQSEIFILKDGKRVNAKSIMGLMSLGLPKGSEIVLEAEGEDAPEALHYLETFVSTIL